MMTNPRTDSAALFGLPGLNLLKRAADPFLAGTPEWLHAMLWAILVMTLLFAMVCWLVRHGLPWVSTVLIPPTRAIIELGGVALLLPEYLVTTLIRRTGGGRVPSVMYLYGDLVQNLTRGCHWTAAAMLKTPPRLRTTSKRALAALLVAVAGFWDVTYCTGAGSACMLPTSQWMKSVSNAVAPSTPKPTACPTKKHSRHATKCTPRHRPKGVH